MRKIAYRKLLAIISVVACTLTLGCTTRLGDFTALSSKNIDVTGIKKGDRLTGESCANVVLGFPLSDGHWETAMDKGLERGKGDVMVDTVVSITSWRLILFGQDCTKMEGTISRTASFSG
jgi:hypothetical protein